MGATLTPLAIVLGGILSATLLFITAWQPMTRPLSRVGTEFARELDVAGLNVRPEALGYILLTIAAIGWIVLVVLTKPTPLQGLLLLFAVAGFVLFATRSYLRMLVARRIRRFSDQLEQVLRMFSGAVRVGLGLRQAIIHVADQSEEPARRELTRVVGASNLGVTLVDALDDLAARMKLHETEMLARLLRVQSQTGSDLAAVLEGLADTIRDRRRFQRKVRAITSQGRATAWLLGLLPVMLGVFIFTTQPEYRAVLLDTSVGRSGLGLATLLDAAAILVLLRLTRIDA